MSLVLEVVSSVVKNLPEMPDDVMRKWVKNPKGLKKALRQALLSSENGSEPKTKAKAEPKPSGLLARVGEPMNITGIAEFTATKEIFQKEANVGDFWSGFENNFLGKTEKGVLDINLVGHQLNRRSVDGPIMEELRDKKEVALWHLFSALKLQSQGQEGILLVNGWANIFYIRDKKGSFWAVGAGWDSGRRCWDLGAVPVASAGPWDADYRVFSRDSDAQ